MNPFRVAVPILLALFFLTACGGGQPAKALTACDLIDQATAQQILDMGIKAQPKTTGPNAIGQTTCFYEPTDDSVMRFVQVSLTFPPEKMRQHMDAVKLYANSRGMVDGAEDISGVGDKAFWGGTGMKMGAGLTVLKGQYMFNVMIAVGDEVKSKDESIKLAKKIASGLE